MINPQWLKLPMSLINFHGPKDVRIIEALLYIQEEWIHLQEWQLPQNNFSALPKGVFSKREEFVFKVDPFSEGTWYAGKQTGSHKSCFLCKKRWKIYQTYPVVLILVLLNPDMPCLYSEDPDQLASELDLHCLSSIMCICNLTGWKLEVGMAS